MFAEAHTPREKIGYVYILASKGRRLYTGVTSDLHLRVRQHKARKHLDAFTARYNIDQLVYYEVFESINQAIVRETRIKNMGRLEKIQLIVTLNRTWRDLSSDWDTPAPSFNEARMKPPTVFRR